MALKEIRYVLSLFIVVFDVSSESLSSQSLNNSAFISSKFCGKV